MEESKKIVLLGQFGVGKTSLLRRFMTDAFDETYKTTLGVQIKKTIIKLPSGRSLSMIVWDLEGFSSVSKTRSSYLLGSNGFIYVFDLTRPITYVHLEEEIAYITTNYPSVALRIIGNKSDRIDATIIDKYLKELNLNIHGYTSAKTGDGVQKIFKDIALKISV